MNERMNEYLDAWEGVCEWLTYSSESILEWICDDSSKIIGGSEWSDKWMDGIID